METTTGPLGQGAATSVGMAIAERWLAATYNRPGYDLFEHNVYALCSDGDMMEGHQQRGGIAGRTSQTVEPLLDLRRQSHHHRGADRPHIHRRRGSPLPRIWMACSAGQRCERSELLDQAYQTFIDTHDRPTLIIVQSHIGYGAPHKHDTQQSAWRAAGRRRSSADEGILRLGPGRRFQGSGRRRGAFPRSISASAGTPLMPPGGNCLPPTGAQYPDLAEQIDQMQRREFPPAGMRRCRLFEPMRKASRRATRPARC